MGALSSFRPIARGVRVFRMAAAVALLLSIAVDISADSKCHCHSAAPFDAGLTLSAAGSPVPADACGDGCVPDCYCCSVLALDPVFRLVLVDAPVVAGSLGPDSGCADGVRQPPYHPPLLLA
jgi:hypothetical protein